MLPQYQTGKLEVPPEVTIVWTDDNDGRMRALPEKKDQWKHGVYYHLAYFSTTTRLTKQVTHIIAPSRVEEEFRRIVQSGATEYMLVNVSELREYVMEARMLAEICWDAQKAFSQANAADRYMQWWAREYFGQAAANDTVSAYRGYYQVLNNYDQISVGSNAVLQALDALGNKLQRKTATSIAADVLKSLQQRDAVYQAEFQTIASASARMTPPQQQYFYENVSFPLWIDWRQTTAAIKLINAVGEPDETRARKLALSAFEDLKTLEKEIQRAKRPPFEKWYRKSWIRNDESPYNVHRSYEHMLAFVVEHYLN